MRSRPQDGIHCTWSIDSSASSRKPSTEANHCSVARKIIGDLQRQQEDDRLSFQRRVLPILSELIRDSGAVAILDNRAVILSAESIDVTDRAIARINEVLGDGAEADEDTVAPAPVPGDPPLSPAPGSAPAPQQ